MAGYDRARRGPSGVELAVAQGAWRSTAHLRYERFDLSEVLALPHSIVELEGDSLPLESSDAAVTGRVAADPPALEAPVAEREISLQSTTLRHGRSRAQAPASAPRPPLAACPPTPKPLTRGKASVGRKVLVPSTLWPAYACDEHGGDGWEARIVSYSRGAALVKFLHARDEHGNPYPSESLSLTVLRPL